MLPAYFRATLQSDEATLEKILRCFRKKKVKRNTLLLAAGTVCRELYFVHKGCVRTYYLTPQGKEKTRHIAFEASFVAAVSSFISQKPSFENVECLEDCEFFAIGHADFFRLVEEVPEWERFYRKLLEGAYILQNEKMESRVTLPAKERYRKLLKEQPAYLQRLSNKILASYLDITQETLSRLKSK